MSELSDESVLRKWIAIEMGRINDGVVVERPRLLTLITSDRPRAVTRGGKEYRFDRDTIHLLDEKLQPGLKAALKVPVIFYFDSNVADSCFLTDGVALECLQVLRRTLPDADHERRKTLGHDFGWLQRAMEVLGKAGIKVVLATPTAAPPLWLTHKHPELLLVEERGLIKRHGTRRAVCLASDKFWDYSKRIVQNMAKALGQHPQLIAWQIDNGLGGNCTEASFNEDARREWDLWLEAKYETIERLNDSLGLRHCGQVVTSWKQVPMPMAAPVAHNPALELDWCRFWSGMIVGFVKVQRQRPGRDAALCHEVRFTPRGPTIRGRQRTLFSGMLGVERLRVVPEGERSCQLKSAGETLSGRRLPLPPSAAACSGCQRTHLDRNLRVRRPRP